MMSYAFFWQGIVGNCIGKRQTIIFLDKSVQKASDALNNRSAIHFCTQAINVSKKLGDKELRALSEIHEAQRDGKLYLGRFSSRNNRF